MSESDTPLTDALIASPVRQVEEVIEHARSLERRLRELERPGVWVPEEPTAHMLVSGASVRKDLLELNVSNVRKIYYAMLAAREAK